MSCFLVSLILTACVSQDGKAACVPVVVEDIYILSCAVVAEKEKEDERSEIRQEQT
jgi:hypothetical protein